MTTDVSGTEVRKVVELTFKYQFGTNFFDLE
jgi:hypothetical protein